jgi:hypothetical protein
VIHAHDTEQLITIARLREWRLRNPQSPDELRLDLRRPVEISAMVLERGGWATADELDVIHAAQRTLMSIQEVAPGVWIIDQLQDVLGLLQATDAASPTIPAPAPAVPGHDLALRLARWGSPRSMTPTEVMT